MTSYLTTKQAADTLGISAPRMRQVLIQGRIIGAKKFGRDWMIPKKFKITPTNKGPKPKEAHTMTNLIIGGDGQIFGLPQIIRGKIEERAPIEASYAWATDLGCNGYDVLYYTTETASVDDVGENALARVLITI